MAEHHHDSRASEQSYSTMLVRFPCACFECGGPIPLVLRKTLNRDRNVELRCCLSGAHGAADFQILIQIFEVKNEAVNRIEIKERAVPRIFFVSSEHNAQVRHGFLCGAPSRPVY